MYRKVPTKNLEVTDKACLDGRTFMKGETTVRGKLSIAPEGSLNVYGTLNLCNATVVQPKLQSRVMSQSDLDRRATNAEDSADQYDIIVCGAGTAGSLLVYRLAQQYPTAKILLLEAGKDDVQDDEVVRTPQDGPNPNKYDANPLLTDDWGQLIRGIFSSLGEGAMAIQQDQRSLTNDQYIPQQKILAMARGVTLGGTSAINVQLWNRGTKIGTYDKWSAATGSDDFGWDAMNQSFISLENRGQSVRYYGSSIPRWLPTIAPVAPGKKFDPTNQGIGGRICLTQDVLPGYTNEAVRQCAISGFGGRTLPVDLNAEDPTNPAEYLADLPSTNYDQSDPTFGSFNPYPASTPGLTYTPPNILGTIRDGSFAGTLPAKLDGPPVVPGQANFKKALTARCFAAPAFIYPLIYPIGNPAVPNNVTIKTKCYITKLVFSETDPTECIGVEYVENGWHVANIARAIRRDVKPWVNTFSNVDRSLCTPEQAAINRAVAISGGYKKAYATADVWVCMGAVDSPALLQRSGVGPKSRLDNLNYSPVSTRVDLPGVGANLQDTVDCPFALVNEIDWNTYLPAYTGAPASAVSPVYRVVFGLADPADPADLIGSSSIGGAPIGTLFETSRMRLKSSPAVPYFDCDLLMGDVPVNFVPFGNNLWGDLASFLGNTETTIDTRNQKFSISNYDRSSIGQYKPSGLNHITTSLFNTEFWNLQSKGEVMITSGDPFDRPNYAPNMVSNENDLDIVENNFVNNILPLVSAMTLQKRGPRGPITYAGIISTGGHVATTTDVQLLASVSTSLFKPFAPAYHISQVDYDTAGSLVGATLTMVSGAAAIPGNNQRVITAWSGFTGVAATSYVATVSAFGALPVGGDQYGLSQASELPLDSVEFTDFNHRNAVRFYQPNGDNIFSDIGTQTLVTDPITTYTGSTRLTFDATAHAFTVGEMIKISGVSGPVDTIPAELINDYHFVTAVPDPNTFEIAVFWNPTALPGTAGTPPTANPAASAIGIVGTGGSDIVVHTLKFDRYKFREWYQYTYFSGWHPSSTCRMGKPTDSTAVVDTRARVYGTLGLRVCDASILPTKPDGNTQAPVYGITQRLFELVSSEEYDNYFL